MTELSVNQLTMLSFIFSPKGFQVLLYKFGVYSSADNCRSGNGGHSTSGGYFKNTIKNLTYYNSLPPNLQVYSEPCQSSKMKHFGEMVT